MADDRTGASLRARHKLSAALRAVAYLELSYRPNGALVMADWMEDLRSASRLSDADANTLQARADRVFTSVTSRHHGAVAEVRRRRLTRSNTMVMRLPSERVHFKERGMNGRRGGYRLKGWFDGQAITLIEQSAAWQAADAVDAAAIESALTEVDHPPLPEVVEWLASLSIWGGEGNPRTDSRISTAAAGLADAALTAAVPDDIQGVVSAAAADAPGWLQSAASLAGLGRPIMVPAFVHPFRDLDTGAEGGPGNTGDAGDVAAGPSGDGEAGSGVDGLIGGSGDDRLDGDEQVAVVPALIAAGTMLIRLLALVARIRRRSRKLGDLPEREPPTDPKEVLTDPPDGANVADAREIERLVEAVERLVQELDDLDVELPDDVRVPRNPKKTAEAWIRELRQQHGNLENLLNMERARKPGERSDDEGLSATEVAALRDYAENVISAHADRPEVIRAEDFFDEHPDLATDSILRGRVGDNADPPARRAVELIQAIEKSVNIGDPSGRRFSHVEVLEVEKALGLPSDSGILEARRTGTLTGYRQAKDIRARGPSNKIGGTVEYNIEIYRDLGDKEKLVTNFHIVVE